MGPLVWSQVGLSVSPALLRLGFYGIEATCFVPDVYRLPRVLPLLHPGVGLLGPLARTLPIPQKCLKVSKCDEIIVTLVVLVVMLETGICVSPHV